MAVLGSLDILVKLVGGQQVLSDIQALRQSTQALGDKPIQIKVDTTQVTKATQATQKEFATWLNDQQKASKEYAAFWEKSLGDREKAQAKADASFAAAAEKSANILSKSDADAVANAAKAAEARNQAIIGGFSAASRGLGAIGGIWDKALGGLSKFSDGMVHAGQVAATFAYRLSIITIPLDILIAKGIQFGSEFETAMAKVGTQLSGTTEQIDAAVAKASTSILALTQQLPVDALDVSKALYYIVSSTSLTYEQAQKAIKPIAELATIGKTSAEELAKGVSVAFSVFGDELKGFGDETQQAQHIVEVFWEAVRKGAVEVSDVPASFARLAQFVHEAGGSFEDATSAWAIMSRAFTAPQASTAIENLAKAIINPKEGARDALKELGVQLGDTQGKIRPFMDVLGDIFEKIGKMGDTLESRQILATIFPNIRGEQAALFFKVADNWKQIIDLRNASVGGSDTFFPSLDRMLQTTNTQMTLAQNNFKVFADAIFTTFEPQLKAALMGISDLFQAATSNPAFVESFGRLAVAVASAAPMFLVLATALMGAGGLVTAIATLMQPTMLIAFAAIWGAIAPAVKDATAAIDAFGGGLTGILGLVTETAHQLGLISGAQAQDIFKQLGISLTAAGSSATSKFIADLRGLLSDTQKMAGGMITFAQGVGQLIDNIQKGQGILGFFYDKIKGIVGFLSGSAGGVGAEGIAGTLDKVIGVSLGAALASKILGMVVSVMNVQAGVVNLAGTLGLGASGTAAAASGGLATGGVAVGASGVLGAGLGGLAVATAGALLEKEFLDNAKNSGDWLRSAMAQGLDIGNPFAGAIGGLADLISKALTGKDLWNGVGKTVSDGINTAVLGAIGQASGKTIHTETPLNVMGRITDSITGMAHAVENAVKNTLDVLGRTTKGETLPMAIASAAAGQRSQAVSDQRLGEQTTGVVGLSVAGQAIVQVLDRAQDGFEHTTPAIVALGDAAVGAAAKLASIAPPDWLKTLSNAGQDVNEFGRPNRFDQSAGYGVTLTDDQIKQGQTLLQYQNDAAQRGIDATNAYADAQKVGADAAQKFADAAKAAAEKLMDTIKNLVKAALTTSDVTDQDIKDTAAGNYKDKPDEFYRRTLAVASGTDPSQYGADYLAQLKLAQGKMPGADFTAIANAFKDNSLFANMSPEEIDKMWNWDAVVASVKNGIARIVGEFKLMKQGVQEALAGLSQDDLAGLKEALGLGASTSPSDMTASVMDALGVGASGKSKDTKLSATIDEKKTMPALREYVKLLNDIKPTYISTLNLIWDNAKKAMDAAEQYIKDHILKYDNVDINITGTFTAAPDATGGAGTAGAGKATGGYVTNGTYKVGEQGYEYVLPHPMVKWMEGILGGKIQDPSQIEWLISALGRGSTETMAQLGLWASGVKGVYTPLPETAKNWLGRMSVFDTKTGRKMGFAEWNWRNGGGGETPAGQSGGGGGSSASSDSSGGGSGGSDVNFHELAVAINRLTGAIDRLAAIVGSALHRRGGGSGGGAGDLFMHADGLAGGGYAYAKRLYQVGEAGSEYVLPHHVVNFIENALGGRIQNAWQVTGLTGGYAGNGGRGNGSINVGTLHVHVPNQATWDGMARQIRNRSAHGDY